MELTAIRAPEDIVARLLEDFPEAMLERKNQQVYINQKYIRQRVIDATGGIFSWIVRGHEFRPFEDGVVLERAIRRNGQATGEFHRPKTMVLWGDLIIPGVGERNGYGAQVLEWGQGEDAAYKGASSDAFKRAAMEFGVGQSQLYGSKNQAVERANTAQRNQDQEPAAPQETARQAKALTPEEMPTEEQKSRLADLSAALGLTREQKLAATGDPNRFTRTMADNIISAWQMQLLAGGQR